MVYYIVTTKTTSKGGNKSIFIIIFTINLIGCDFPDSMADMQNVQNATLQNCDKDHY